MAWCPWSRPGGSTSDVNMLAEWLSGQWVAPADVTVSKDAALSNYGAQWIMSKQKAPA
jgi:hypothetical protein